MELVDHQMTEEEDEMVDHQTVEVEEETVDHQAPLVDPMMARIKKNT